MARFGLEEREAAVGQFLHGGWQCVIAAPESRCGTVRHSALARPAFISRRASRSKCLETASSAVTFELLIPRRRVVLCKPLPKPNEVLLWQTLYSLRDFMRHR